ncbi:MAG: acyl-CoA dehydrogenase family protein [Acetobacteraceae bacterium]
MQPVVAIGEDFPELRDAVRRICARYPGSYWRELDDKEDYPTAFIDELTKAGFLASLIPEEYGGSGLPLRAAAVILEEINASGCTASQGHAQMYIMGTLLRHGSAAQKQRYLPQIARGARCGCRLSASPNQPAARTRRASRPAPCGMATTM